MLKCVAHARYRPHSRLNCETVCLLIHRWKKHFAVYIGELLGGEHRKRVLAGISTARGFRLWARKREDIRKLSYYDVSMNLCGTTFHCSYTSLVIVFAS